MIKLDYQTRNPRWGWSGIRFSDWISYSFTLGYLSNINHYDNAPNGYTRNGNISVHIERNNEQGAWDKEGRIHYYGTRLALQRTLSDLYDCSSAGTGRITRRINSNGYIISLIEDFDFELVTYIGYTTADVFPVSPENIRTKLERHLRSVGLSQYDVERHLQAFDDGYSI